MIFIDKTMMIMPERVNREVSKETRIKKSVKKQGELNPNYQKSRDVDTRTKISQALKRYWQSIPKKVSNDDGIKGF